MKTTIEAQQVQIGHHIIAPHSGEVAKVVGNVVTSCFHHEFRLNLELECDGERVNLHVQPLFRLTKVN